MDPFKRFNVNIPRAVTALGILNLADNIRDIVLPGEVTKSYAANVGRTQFG